MYFTAGGKLKNESILPFQNMTKEGWQNLALASVLFFYVLQVGFDLITHNICGNLAVDYCAYWSTGKLISQNGYAEMYNVNLLTGFQKNIYPESFDVVPFPYLPVFAIPFQLLSLLNLNTSFFVWTLINLVGFIAYLIFFVKEITKITLTHKLTLLIILSLPVFWNLFLGQVNIWLGICAGEFIREIHSNKPFRAGLWLGGLLLKPQVLVLIIPILLLQRKIKILSGFITSSIVILLISFGLIYVKGTLGLINLLLGSATGGAASYPLIMMNWRMLGMHLVSFTSPIIGWSAIIVGTIVTIFATLYFFRKPIQKDFEKTVIALLGIFAATGAVTWHAHLSMSIIFIPAMIYLYVKDRFSKKIFLLWAFMPTAIMLIIYTLAALMKSGILPTKTVELLYLLTGLRGLSLNLIILVWAIKENTKNPPAQESYKLGNEL